MADIVYNKLSPKEATREISGIAEYGDLIPSHHLLYDHPERGYDIQDVREVLVNGKVTDPPQYDHEHDNWVYRVRGNVIEGDRAIVVVAFISNREIRCITIRPE